MTRTKSSSSQRKSDIAAAKPKRSRTAASGSSKKKTDGVQKAEKKKHRWRAGTVALREIRRLQKTTDSVVPRQPLERKIREITHDMTDGGETEYRFTKGAMDALLEAAEFEGLRHLEASRVVAESRGQITITPANMHTVNRILDIFGGRGSDYFKSGASSLVRAPEPERRQKRVLKINIAAALQPVEPVVPETNDDDDVSIDSVDTE